MGLGLFSLGWESAGWSKPSFHLMKIILATHNAWICWYFNLARNYRRGGWCFVEIFPFTQKKNPTSVSTGGVLGRANNWRSLDSRKYELANAVPKWIANFQLYSATKIVLTIPAAIATIHCLISPPLGLPAWKISQGNAKSPWINFLAYRHIAFQIGNQAWPDLPNLTR